jgi:hypothetical protein
MQAFLTLNETNKATNRPGLADVDVSAATWLPCSSLLGSPPITWSVPTETLAASDPRKTGERVEYISRCEEMRLM